MGTPRLGKIGKQRCWGIRFLTKNLVKISCKIKPRVKSDTKIMWIKIQLKREKILYIGISNGKQKSRNPIKTLDKEFPNIEQIIYQYIIENQQNL